MNILNTYTFKTLKENKSRTMVTIVGIVLSLAMLTCVTTLISTSQTWLKNSVIDSQGMWHGAILRADEDVRQDMVQNEDIRHTFAMHYVGFAPLEAVSDREHYYFVASAEDEFFRNMPVNITQGRLPENSREIILPENVYLHGGIQHSLGQQITLQTGRRVLDGEELSVQNPYTEGEVLTDTVYTEYTIVGFYQRTAIDYSQCGYTLFTTDRTGDLPCSIYYIAEDISETFNIMDRYTAVPYLCGSLTNTSLLRFSGMEAHKGYNGVLYSLGIVLMTIIVFASIALIYNAFSISIGERTKQFGLLSSIGATRRQLRASVVAEALMLCVIGVPLGIATGLCGIALTLKLTQSVFRVGFEHLAFAGADNVAFDMVVSPYAIGIAAVTGIITIMISAWLPARKALKNTAIDALRLTNEIKLTAKDIKTNPLVTKLFGVEATVAARNFRRSKRRYRATVISLFMSVVLFVSAWSFCDELEKSISIAAHSADFDLIYYHYPKRESLSLKELQERFSVIDGVKAVYYCRNVYIQPEINEAVFTESYKAMWGDDKNYIDIIFLDDENYYSWAEEKGYSHMLSDGNIHSFAVNICSKYDYEKDFYHETKVFEKEDIEFASPLTGKTVKIHLCSTLPLGLEKDTDGFLTVVMPYSSIGNFIKDSEDMTRNILVSAENPNAAEKKMASIVTLPGNIVNYYQEYQTNRAVINILNVFTYGFIALISLIACANVFNTISTNVALRRREFAVLRSVGMSGRSFDRMMIYECLMYGTKSILYGLPVSLAVSLWIYNVVRKGFATAYVPPVKGMAIAVLSVFIVVIITMIYATRKVKKENILDALKDENL